MGTTVKRRRKSECPTTTSTSTRGLVEDDNGNGYVLCKKPKDANDRELSEPPSLRRAGSSTIDFMSSFGDDENDLFSPSKSGQMDRGGLTALATTLHLLVGGMTADFCKNGLPWEGQKCRSKIAGLSGILYALPALVAVGHPYDQIMWTVQAMLSILADYCYICQDSFWHGVDRYFAIFNAVTIVWRVSVVLSWHIAFLMIIPMGCFVGASRAKDQRDLDSWHVWHCLWHVSSGPLVGVVVYMIHNCQNTATSMEAGITASQ